MSKKEQSKYLEQYPKSSHRFLLEGKKKGKSKAKAEPVKMRKLSRSAYDTLSKKQKAMYDEAFPKSKHKPRVPKGRKPKDVKLDAKETRRQGQKRRKAHNDAAKNQHDVMHIEGAGTINRESVKALALIEPKHLQQAAGAIMDKRFDIAKDVTAAFSDKKELFANGISSLRSMMNGESAQKPKQEEEAIDAEYEEIEDDEEAEGAEDAPEVDPSHWQDSDGNTKTFDDGRPVTKEAMSEFEKNRGRFKPRMGDNKLYVDENGEKQFFDDGTPMTVGERRELDYEDMAKMRAGSRSRARPHRDGKKQRDGKAVLNTIIKYGILAAGVSLIAVAAGPMAAVVGRGMLDMWSDLHSLVALSASEKDEDTLQEVIKQVSSYIRNMDHEDLKEGSQDMFTAFASADVELFPQVLLALMPLTNGKPKGRPGSNITGNSMVSLERLVEAIEDRLKACKFAYVVEQENYMEVSYYFHVRVHSSRNIFGIGMIPGTRHYHVIFMSKNTTRGNHGPDKLSV